MMIQEAFQYPTRLSRTAHNAGRPFFMRPETKSGREHPAACGCYLLLRPPPRLPSMLRFRSAIFPSEEERNCLSLSSKDWSPAGGSAAASRDAGRKNRRRAAGSGARDAPEAGSS